MSPARVVVRTQGPAGDPGDPTLVADGAIPAAKITGTAVITTDPRLTDARTPTTHAASHLAGGTDDLYDPADMSSTVVEPFNGFHNATTLTMTSQRPYLMPFRARATRTISNLFSRSRGTAAAGLTLARMGLYSVDPGTNIATLVARIASDTSLWASTFTTYSRALDTTGGYPASYQVARGSWYAFGVIAVGTTMPGLSCSVGMSYPSAAAARLRLAAGNFQSSQADLWTSVDIDSLTVDPSGIYVGGY